MRNPVEYRDEVRKGRLDMCDLLRPKICKRCKNQEERKESLHIQFIASRFDFNC